MRANWCNQATLRPDRQKLMRLLRTPVPCPAAPTPNRAARSPQMAGRFRRCYIAEMNSWTQQARQAAKAIAERASTRPSVGIVLGTGLGDVASAVEIDVRVDTSSVPYFPPSTVDGHAGAIVVGRLAGKTVAVL